jgi:hypothetical protein
MMDKFKEMSKSDNVHFQTRDKFEHLHKILGEHKFWNNQAIQKSFEFQKEGQIKVYKPEDISDEPTPLPPGFEWYTFDADDDAEVDRICEFLMDHYVEDTEGNFRLYYTKEKFRWGVCNPGRIKDLNFLVINSKNKKIMASLVACPKKIVING